jgi:MarR family transcriptional regulator, 2-MHQ and catechol-resistance regulon repressor
MKIDEIIKANFQSPQQKVIVNIRYTSNCLSNAQNSFMSKFDLTMPQFNILRILRGAKDSISVNTIKDRMIEKSPNTTRLMDKLIDKKLIERVRCDEDRRVVYVKITKNGLELLSQIDNEFNLNSLNNVDLTNEEAELLSDLLDKLRDSYRLI